MKEYHIYHGSKAHALEIYNRHDKSTILNIKPTAAVIHFSAVFCAIAVVTSGKTFRQFLLKKVCIIHDISANCLGSDVATDGYFD